MGGYYEAGARGLMGGRREGEAARKPRVAADCLSGSPYTSAVRGMQTARRRVGGPLQAAVLLSGNRTCQCQPLKVCRQANSMALSSTARSARSRRLIFFRVPP
jgi:hypothetical protein